MLLKMELKQTDPSQQHRDSSYGNHKDKVVPHVARIHLSAPVGPDILSQHRGLANPGLVLGQRRVKSSHWEQLGEGGWEHLKPLQRFAKQMHVDFPLICSQLKAELGSNHSCSPARACSSKVLTPASCGSQGGHKPPR